MAHSLFVKRLGAPRECNRCATENALAEGLQGSAITGLFALRIKKVLELGKALAAERSATTQGRGALQFSKKTTDSFAACVPQPRSFRHAICISPYHYFQRLCESHLNGS